MAQESEREAPTSHEAEEHGLPPPRKRVIARAMGHSPQCLHHPVPAEAGTHG